MPLRQQQSSQTKKKETGTERDGSRNRGTGRTNSNVWRPRWPWSRIEPLEMKNYNHFSVPGSLL
jgi:hypothetical protein